MHEGTGLRLSQACAGKSVIRLTGHFNMTIAADWELKTQNKKEHNTVPEVSLKPATTKFFVIINGCKVVHCTKCVCKQVSDDCNQVPCVLP